MLTLLAYAYAVAGEAREGSSAAAVRHRLPGDLRQPDPGSLPVSRYQGPADRRAWVPCNASASPHGRDDLSRDFACRDYSHSIAGRLARQKTVVSPV